MKNVHAESDARAQNQSKPTIEKEKSYRELIENLNDIVYTTDDKAIVTWVSPNISRLSGYTPDEVIGKNFIDFVAPDDLTGRIDQFLKILGGTTQATEYRLVTKTGEIKWARTNGRPIRREGRVVGVQGILVDITDQKKTEEALRQSEEKYRILVQHAKDAIFVIQEERIRFMNPKASEILGYTCEGIADRSFIDFVHPDDRAAIVDRYIRRLRGEPLSDQISFRILNKDGDVRDVDLNAVLISWEKKPAILNFLRDITRHNQMEAQLRYAQKMEALGTLAGGIAHNFNNLLMGIHGNVSLSLMRLDPSASSIKYLENINKLVESGSRLTHQLLDSARGGSCEFGTVDVNQLVREVSETLTATKKHIRLHPRLSEKIPCIQADRGQIEQVLLNLFLNAADAMPDGGNVFIETSALTGAGARGKAALSSHRTYVLLKVSDGGTGIPEKNLDRIFEPFFTTKGLENGTGLGLSTAYGIAKSHYGDIAVESEVDKGSSFFVYLPASEDGLAATETMKVSEAATGQGTILLVDDDASVIETSAELLELMGFAVLTASCGPDALGTFLKKWQLIDLVILDLIMPEMSGKALYHQMKKINPGVKVLLSSGFSVSGEAEDLLRIGCHGFIQKPYDIKQLSATIVDILSAE
ncbi:hypothetical protein DSCA_34150 [Desulfosarcina alkanivorans]|uniref:histidine kinase n=1 Tax=Desulfosarcina alkanivorans TaxID=571177 RepID=A0A5K7YM75_9BACT|nr:PAS domain-containing hybrid sensor histidine kinase/response regulator [Desulfosarcina alkanivorans]BBO69485.1 hypothetical protein DSCA_34150 [Desulfosarcina alkanivorans]